MMKPKISLKQCQELFAQVAAVLPNTFPKKGEGYAVAVLTNKGHIYTGVSYCSDTYTLTMHGEAVALAHANSHL